MTSTTTKYFAGIVIILVHFHSQNVCNSNKAAILLLTGKIAASLKYTWRDHKTDEEILNKLKVTSVVDKITSHKTEWIQHKNRMPRSRLPVY
jgi:hypothetical protein